MPLIHRTTADLFEYDRLTALHEQVYDRLAAQYEQRAETLRPLTSEAARSIHRYVASGRVLDVGCGVGLMADCLTERGLDVLGIDISRRMVDLARHRNRAGRIVRADLLNLNIRGQFDGIAALAFIHLYPKSIADECLNRMHSFLRPGGHLFVNTTAVTSRVEEGYLPKEDYQGGFIRFRKVWAKDEFESSLVNAGFDIVEFATVDDPFGKTWMDWIACRPCRPDRLRRGRAHGFRSG